MTMQIPLRSFRPFWKKGGYLVVPARSGAEAIERAKREAPALVILDLILPDRNGLNVLETLKNLASMKNVPVLIVSAMPDKLLIERSYALGVCQYLIKPVYPLEILEHVRKHLSRSSKAPSLRIV